MKLNQAIAVLNGTKADAKKATTKVYQLAQKTDLFNGISRTYEPLNEEGFVYPSEGNTVQISVEGENGLIKQFETALSDLFNIAATQDWGNQDARATVAVGNRVILEDVPISYLLFLEKQLQDIKTFISALPVQDISENWRKDEQRDLYCTEAKYTTKTKKITKPVVLHPGTPEHPPQVDKVSEDVPEGKWQTIKFTTALTRSRHNELIRRIDQLTQAVIFARETANSIDVDKKNVASPIFSFLFDV